MTKQTPLLDNPWVVLIVAKLLGHLQQESYNLYGDFCWDLRPYCDLHGDKCIFTTVKTNTQLITTGR